MSSPTHIPTAKHRMGHQPHRLTFQGEAVRPHPHHISLTGLPRFPPNALSSTHDVYRIPHRRDRGDCRRLSWPDPIAGGACVLATKTAWIGVPIGLVAALALARFGKMPRLVFLRRSSGRGRGGCAFWPVEFAASYAENALAGKFWYFGWIGVAAAASAFLAALLSRNRI